MGKKISVVYFVIFLGCALQLQAQDSAIINYLIKRIAQQQTTTDAFFLPGIYPSYITNDVRFTKKKKDNNIFFNALVDYTVQGLMQKLSKQNLQLLNSSRQQSLPLYPLFKNKKGRNTYNFWRTDSAYTFPYTWWIPKIKKNNALPDDLDDTVLSLLAQNTDSASAAAVHTKMQEYTNTGNINSIGNDYRNYNAYSVWYGKNFPVVFDVCVLSNVLSFVQTYNLGWTTADSASVQLIVHTIKTGDYLKKPLYVSPYYGNSSIVLYHLARLMRIKNIPELEALKPQLIADAITLFTQTKNPLEKAILCTAIYKWGYVPPSFSLPSIANFLETIEHNDLPFFIGNIPSYFANGIKQIVTKKAWGLFYHYCPAYNNVLMLEYLLLKQTSEN